MIRMQYFSSFIRLIASILLTGMLWSFTDTKQNGAPISLLWEMGQNEVAPGIYDNRFILINHSNKPLKENWVIYFSQNPAEVIHDATAPLVIEQICATHYRMFPSPNYLPLMPGDTLIVYFRCRGGIVKNSNAPEGAYLVMRDKNGRELQPITIPVDATPLQGEGQWSRPGVNELPYPDGERVYRENSRFTEAVALTNTDIFPSVKEVVHHNGSLTFTKSYRLLFDEGLQSEAALLSEQLKQLFNSEESADGATLIHLVKGERVKENDEGYRLTISEGVIEIRGAGSHAVFNGTQTLIAMLRNDRENLTLPYVTITDYPDLHHRGQMIDVARNFTTKEDLLRLIDLFASYKLNVLHLHLTDDEGWRLEIPGLEELTTVGARRGHTLDEADRLYPAYGSGWDHEEPDSPGNGYYSRSDFIEILRYAGERHMKVIPEVDLPGHARAAIKAMNARYRKYIESDPKMAGEYLLTDFDDRSEYLSAQSYTDNVINVALPSAYRFVQKVVDEIAAMYEEAGMELSLFHIGGDEVPHGAWTGSDIAHVFMLEQGMTETRELKDFFVDQVSGILRDKGLQMAAWQEVALLPDDTPNPRFAGENVLSYCWNTIPDWESDEITYHLANEGYPVILCNVSNLYFDLSYSKHPEEPGAYWGGFVNEYNAFNMLPWEIYKSVRNDLSGNPIDIIAASATKQPLTTRGMKNVKGMQGQLWSETIRHFDMLQYSLFPKIIGLVERAWNTLPKWSKDPCGGSYLEALRKFNAKVAQHELPYLATCDVAFHLPQPGILIKEGRLLLNSSIPGATIRYTVDGSVPNGESTLWNRPVPCEAKVVKAKLFYMGRESVTTLYQTNTELATQCSKPNPATTQISHAKTNESNRLQLIPIPQQVTCSGEGIELPHHLTIGADFAYEAAVLLADLLNDIEGTVAEVDTCADAFIRFYRDPTLEKEAYRIRTNSNGIVIEAAERCGALWAIQTLQQLFMQVALQSPEKKRMMPVVMIEDAPRFAWRGFHLDLARHMFTKEYLKKTIERLANYKINKLHLHLSDDQGWRLESAAFPLLTEKGGWRTLDKNDSICIRRSANDSSMAIDKRFLRNDTLYGGYYTRKEIKEIIAYADRYGIEVIPEIDMPGHMSAAIRAYPWLSCRGSVGWGKEFSHPLCMAKPEVRVFAKKVLEEVAELFPSSYIHIGADEVETTIWEQCPLCREKMRSQNISDPRELQTQFVEEMHDYLKSIGKKTVVWDDAADEKVSSEILVTFWRDWKNENAAQIVEMGHPMIFATWSHFYLSAKPSFSRWKALYHFDITNDYPGMTDDKLIGYQACVWTEEIPGEAKLEEHIFPSLQAFSERVWSRNRDWNDFMRRMPLHYLIMERKSINYYSD